MLQPALRVFEFRLQIKRGCESGAYPSRGFRKLQKWHTGPLLSSCALVLLPPLFQELLLLVFTCMGLATRHAGPRRDHSRPLWLSFFSQGLQSLGKGLAVASCKKSAVCPGSQGQRVPAAVTQGSRSRPFWAWPVSRCNLQVCSPQSTSWLSTMDCWQHTAGSRLLQERCSASHALCLWSLMPRPALEDDFIKGHQDNCLLRGTLFCAEAR